MNSLLASLLATTALAMAVPAPLPTVAPQFDAEKRAATKCTFTDYSAVIASQKSCATVVLDNIAVPKGKTLDLTNIADGTHVIFEGKTTFEFEEWAGPLISVAGDSITVTGASGHVINGNGTKWWDGKGSNGGVQKPKFFFAHSMTNSQIVGLNVVDTPVQAFSISGSTNLNLDHITIDSSKGDTEGGHNTDGFDVGDSTNIAITNAIVKNQDDCLAINSGKNISFIGGACSGGHGLSIGSVGGRSNNVVDLVTIKDSSISDSQNGVRVKTISGATGTVTGVTYENIQLSGITDYGIVVEQDYNSAKHIATNGVKITDLTLNGVTGTVASGATEIYILCGSGSCTDWTWSGVKLTGGEKSSSCSNVPSGVSC